MLKLPSYCFIQICIIDLFICKPWIMNPLKIWLTSNFLKCLKWSRRLFTCYFCFHNSKIFRSKALLGCIFLLITDVFHVANAIHTKIRFSEYVNFWYASSSIAKLFLPELTLLQKYKILLVPLQNNWGTWILNTVIWLLSLCVILLDSYSWPTLYCIFSAWCATFWRKQKSW